MGSNPPLKPRYEKGNIKLNFSIDYRINHYWITSRSKLFITMAFKNEIIQKIRREFTEKEKYNILMEDYFNMIKKVSNMQELQYKYDALKEQHKRLQSKYTKLKNR